jgi:TM2 domain-containing membrane protein YozV
MQGVPIQPPIFFKNPTVATLLSFLHPGLGQFYNGQIGKGIAHLAVMAVSYVLMFVVVGFVTATIMWIWSMVDANTSAKQVNQRLAAGASPLQAAQ